MSWSPDLFIGEARPWPDSVHVVRGRTEEERRYFPRETCRMERDNAWSSDFDWRCTACGEHVSTCNEPPRWCPSCGRVVVSR